MGLAKGLQLAAIETSPGTPLQLLRGGWRHQRGRCVRRWPLKCRLS